MRLAGFTYHCLAAFNSTGLIVIRGVMAWVNALTAMGAIRTTVSMVQEFSSSASVTPAAVQVARAAAAACGLRSAAVNSLAGAVNATVCSTNSDSFG